MPLFKWFTGLFFWSCSGVSKFLKMYSKPDNEKILVIVLHKIGDSIFTIPAVNEIIKHYNREIYVLCFEEMLPVFELIIKKEFLISARHSDFYFSDRFAKGKVRKKIKQINPGIIYDFTGSIRSASLLFNSGANITVGINEEPFKRIYSDFVRIRTEPHIMDIYLDVVRKKFHLPDDNKIKEFPVTEFKKGYILIHPFAGWAAKEWNIEKFIMLAEKLKLTYDVVFIARPGEIIGEVLSEIIKKGIRLLETQTTEDMIKVIRSCSIFIANDSGPLNIANFLGKPTFTIYGPTNPEFLLPYGKHHGYIQKKISCSPEKGKNYCFTNAGRNGCPSFECMNLLGTDEVYLSVKKFLNEIEIEIEKNELSGYNKN